MTSSRVWLTFCWFFHFVPVQYERDRARVVTGERGVSVKLGRRHSNQHSVYGRALHSSTNRCYLPYRSMTAINSQVP